jgi:hypothetical protein
VSLHAVVDNVEFYAERNEERTNRKALCVREKIKYSNTLVI